MSDDDNEVPKRRPYTRDDIAAHVAKMTPEERERFRKIGANALGMVVPAVSPKLPRYAEPIVPTAAIPEYDISWEDGKSPYDIAEANTEASKMTATLLGELLAANKTTAKSNRKTTWINTGLAAISCAAAIYAAITATAH